MSYSSYPQPAPGPYGYRPHPTLPTESSNNAAIIGFVLSICGIVLCGLTAPVGLIVSAVGMKKQNLQGLAIAGLIIGILGTIYLVVAIVYFVFVIGVLASLFAALGWAASEASQRAQTYSQINNAKQAIERFATEQGSLPDEKQGMAIVSEFDDAWGNALRYEKEATEVDRYKIISSGQDEQFGTVDDINSTFHSAHARFQIHGRSSEP